jgi:hypothetical protein
MRKIDGGLKWGNPLKTFSAFKRLPVCLMGLALLAPVFHSLPASAVTSYTKQTGQPCATCHTAFPELTPFGRQFKLRAFTGGGNRCDTAIQNSANDKLQLPFSSTVVATAEDGDDVAVQEVSVYLAGQLYCNLGSFVEASWDKNTDRFSLSDTDIRYAREFKFEGNDLLFGLTLNNGPTSHNVWKTSPMSSLPFSSQYVNNAANGGTNAATTGTTAQTGPLLDTALAEGTIEGAFQDRVIGLGVYGFLNDRIFGEIAAYTSIDQDIASALGVAPSPSGTIDSVAAYWRVAGEYTLGKQTFMLGTFGMIMDVERNNLVNHVTDIGLDAMYQYTANDHRLTLKGRLSTEDSSLNPTSTSVKLSGTYVYDRQWSFQAGYYTSFGDSNQAAAATPVVAASAATTGTNNTANVDDDDDDDDDDEDEEYENTKPVTLMDGNPGGAPGSGIVMDFGYMPFNKDAVSSLPLATGRIGIQYNHSEADTTGDSNDTAFAYIWMAF